MQVSYAHKRLEIDIEEQLSTKGSIGDETSRKLLTTKFKDWEYENEVRMFVKPEETYEELGLSFIPFGENLKLKEVVLGPRSTATNTEVLAAVQQQDDSVDIIYTRLAFQSFRVIQTLPTKLK